ncbi:MAG: ATP-binding cassette domain-containing protein [Desulfurococcales archaeon]|nr:ATP-binding cassette domain-containing protein [Desulfurococcales archaeon]
MSSLETISGLFARKGVRVRGERLIKVYRKGALEVQALRGVSVDFEPGKMYVVMGPSGSGKTTLMNLLGGVDRPTGGLVFHGDKRIDNLGDTELDDHRLDYVGFVFQTINLIPTLTAKDNVELPLLFKKVPKSTREYRVMMLLEAMGLKDKATHKPGELSGGEQQRVAIAVALANDPPIIIADEPTAELDYENAKKIVDILHSLALKHGKTVIVTTHDPRVAVRADRIIRLEDGVTKGEFTPVELEEAYTPTKPKEDTGVYTLANIVRARLARVNEEIEELQRKLMKGELSIEEAFERYQDLSKQKKALEDLLASIGG